MFNQGSSSGRFNNYKILGGISMGDYDSHRTMFVGPDPADSNRVIIRKLVQTSDSTWAFEEATVTPGEEGQKPTVHSTAHRLGHLDINEKLDEHELALRLQYRAMPNVIGFSLFSRPWASGSRSAWSIVENSLTKKSKYRWSEWLKDCQDKRDLSAYLKMRWMMN